MTLTNQPHPEGASKEGGWTAGPNFGHPLVGRAVVYRGTHPNAEPEQGIVSSVNVGAAIVFVRYGNATNGTATSADDRLTFLDGSPVSAALSLAQGDRT